MPRYTHLHTPAMHAPALALHCYSRAARRSSARARPHIAHTPPAHRPHTHTLTASVTQKAWGSSLSGGDRAYAVLRLLMMRPVQGDLHQPCTPSSSFGDAVTVVTLSVLAGLSFGVAALVRRVDRRLLHTLRELAASIGMRAQGAVLVARRLDADRCVRAR